MTSDAKNETPVLDAVEKYYQELIEAVNAPSVAVPVFDSSKELLTWMRNLKYSDFTDESPTT